MKTPFFNTTTVDGRDRVTLDTRIDTHGAPEHVATIGKPGIQPAYQDPLRDDLLRHTVWGKGI